MTLAGAILVVEDDADCRSVLGELLALEGHSVVGCADATSALERARQETPALVMVDLHLPGRDGTWLVETLAAAGPPLSRVPIILTTGSVDAREVGKRLGVSVLEKPFEGGRMLEMVDALLLASPAPRP